MSLIECLGIALSGLLASGAARAVGSECHSRGSRRGISGGAETWEGRNHLFAHRRHVYWANMFIESRSPEEFVALLQDHFLYLADTPGYEEVLRSLMAKAKRIEKVDFYWRVVFAEGEEWEVIALDWGRPLKDSEHTHLPNHHRELVAPHHW